MSTNLAPKNEERSVVTLSDEKIQDYLDGRLSKRERSVVAAILIGNPDIRREVTELWLLNEMIRSLGQHILDEPVPDRLTEIVRTPRTAVGRFSKA